MLSTAHRILDGQLTVDRSGKRAKKIYVHPNEYLDSRFYKVAHANHPCTLWVMQSHMNYLWLFIHFVSLCKEYTYRYGKTHATEIKLMDILLTPPKNIPRTDNRTPFVLAMKAHPECVVEGDPVKSYRNFYRTKQDRFKMVWTRREVPEFML